MATERQLFLTRWLRDPLGIGAALPSGDAVASAVAREMRLHGSGVVLELGAGTGSVTRGLLGAGCPPDRLVAVEREPELARHLRRSFPDIRVLEGDVADLAPLLDAAGIGELACVLSTLPIKWFSLEVKRQVVAAVFSRLHPEGVLVQVTNAFRSPLPCTALGLDGQEVARIWWHFLPTQVWVYRRAKHTA